LTALLQDFSRYGETKTSVILSTDLDERPIFAECRTPASA
jgi:hypothetical protein